MTNSMFFQKSVLSTDIFLDNVHLEKIREQVFKGKGYYIFKSFIPENSAIEIRDFYLKTNNCMLFSKNSAAGNRHFFYPTSPFQYPDFIKDMYLKIVTIRNQIYETQPWYKEYRERFSLDNDPLTVANHQKNHNWACFYLYKEGDSHFRHKDEYGELAVFLVLSEIGKDYSQGGLKIYDDNNVPTYLDQHYNYGDLVVFDQTRFEHEVEPVHTTKGQCGRFQWYIPNIPYGRINKCLKFEGSNKLFFAPETSFLMKMYFHIKSKLNLIPIHYSRKKVSYATTELKSHENIMCSTSNSKNSYFDDIKSLQNNSSIFIYGSGSLGIIFLNSIQFYRPDITVKGFIDKYKAGTLLNIPIISLNDYMSVNETKVIIATDPSYWAEVANDLKMLGVIDYSINRFYDFDIFGDKEVNKIEKFQEDINKVDKLFSTKEDRETWRLITDAMQCNNIGHLLKNFESLDIRNENYLDFGLKLNKDDVVIDAGCMGGTQTSDFAKLVGENGKVFAFDPRALINTTPFYSSNKIIQVIPKALWHSKIKIYFNDNGSTTTVTTEKKATSFEVEAISIDEFISENNINRLNYIKFDIEGAELDSLKGAENSIKKFRPILAISMYHKLEHYFEIPLYLNSILDDYQYRLSLNHPFSIGTIFFAFPC